MQIPLNRDIKVMLLRWLKQGFIDTVELHTVQDAHPITLEEIDREMDRLMALNGSEECERLKRLGWCAAYNNTKAYKTEKS